MLKPVTNITISQRGSGRSQTLFFDFVNEWEVSSNWEKLTDTGSVKFPKNTYIKDTATGKKFPLFGQNKNTGELFQRGDQIKIECFYIYYDENLNQKQTKKQTVLDGYISKVISKTPIELEIEDSMWLLKQIPMKNQSFAVGTSIESILTEVLQGTGLSVSYVTATELSFDNGLLNVENETIAQFLAKLKADYFINAFFRGKELFVGSLVYSSITPETKKFQFQKTIISSDLEFSKKEDVILSAVASNHIEELTGKMTKDGQAKTKKTRIEVLVTLKDDKIISKSVKSGDKADPLTDGERRSFTYPFAKTERELIDLAEADLRKYYFDGFKGSFETFGTPFVRFGDHAELSDEILPEHDGTYKIKAVEYKGGTGGLRQKITLDFKLRT